MVHNKPYYALYYEYAITFFIITYYLLLMDASEVETSRMWIIYNLCWNMRMCATLSLWKERNAMMTCVLLFLGVKLGLLFTKYLSNSVNFIPYIYTHTAFWDSLYTQPYTIRLTINTYNNYIFKYLIEVRQYG